VGFLAVFGHANIDYIARVNAIPGPDESAAFTGPARSLGGTAANIAAWAAALGAPTSLAAMVGPDFPPEYARALQRRGVDTRPLRRVKGSTTPVCWIFSDARGHQAAFINQGAAVEGAKLPVDRAAIRRAKVVHIATGPASHHARVAAEARRGGRTVAFDPGQELSYSWTPASFRRILRQVDVLFLNDAERLRARRYLGASSDGELLRRVPALVLTHGERGSEFLSRRERAACPIARADRTVNTTGAGDAFRGGYYAALHRGLGPGARLAWGAAAASLAVEHQGTQPGRDSSRRFAARLRRSFPRLQE
jgi:ribokinase